MPKLRHKPLKPYWATADGELVQLYHGDVIDVLRRLATASVQCVVTSPPYWGLQDYGTDKTLEIGSERTPEEYVEKMVSVFREVHRVLRDGGTVWLNMGDSYGSPSLGRHDVARKYPGSIGKGLEARPSDATAGLKPGNLCGVPWRLALALQADEWVLRQDIIWAKPDPMPESVRNRCTKAHEYLFLLTKGMGYYCDMEAVKDKSVSSPHSMRGKQTSPDRNDGDRQGIVIGDGCSNKRSVWTIATQSYEGAHFATFPKKLVEPCVLAGTSAKGCCPTCGAPWSRVMEKGGYSKSNRPSVRMQGSPHDQGADMSKVGGGYWSSTNLGWRPGCRCYGYVGGGKVELMGDQPSKPARKTLVLRWRKAMQVWRAKWEELEPVYSRLAVVPCVVLDPFVGSGTTCCVALGHGRRSIGIDLSEDYLRDNAIPRIEGELLSRPELAGLIGREVKRVEVGEDLV